MFKSNQPVIRERCYRRLAETLHVLSFFFFFPQSRYHFCWDFNYFFSLIMSGALFSLCACIVMALKIQLEDTLLISSWRVDCGELENRGGGTLCSLLWQHNNRKWSSGSVLAQTDLVSCLQRANRAENKAWAEGCMEYALLTKMQGSLYVNSTKQKRF